MRDVSALFSWLVEGAPGATGPEIVVRRLGEGLVAAGIPVDRITTFVSTLHPTVFGRGFNWTPGSDADIIEIPHEFFTSALFDKSPIAAIVRGLEIIHERIDPVPGQRPYPVYDDLAHSGFVDYLALPICFITGERHAITFATKHAEGFSEEDVAAIQRVMPPISRLAEILALRRTAATLLDTYVGRNSGGRILAGQIQRGDVETMNAVIWFSDLRGFTEMSSRLPAKDVVDAINVAFDAQVRAIEARGGEVLKFMGDGLLAIFPLSGDVGETCEAAIAAAEDALADLAEKSEGRGQPLRVGIGLHLGELAYGNVGGAQRLDFTAIGSAVNVAARLEAMTSRLGETVVASRELGTHLARPSRPLGAHALKGVAEPVEIVAPALRAGQPSAASESSSPVR